METKPIIHIVGTQCRPEDEAKFNKWYDEIHTPLLLKFKGIKEVTRYKITKGIKEVAPFRVTNEIEEYETEEYPAYLAIYKFESQNAYEAYLTSPELAAAWGEAKKTWPDGGFRIKWRVQYEPI